jgi:hypothetical protein
MAREDLPAVFTRIVKKGYPFPGKRKPWYGLELPDLSQRIGMKA